MTPSLPTSPSLRFLKEQAKDLLKARKAGDPACCQVLRRLHRFAQASDAEILAADVPLKEVQFALAMDYGFASWQDLRAHVLKDVAERVTKKCWETSAFHKGQEYVLDDEALALNDMASRLGELADWAVSVREQMPKYGFELCSHRWVEGLEEAMKMIAAQKAWPTEAGRCGDVPAAVTQAALQRAGAVQAWLNGQAPSDPIKTRVAAVLGQPTPEKTEAAECFVQLVKICFDERRDPKESAKQWRAKAVDNPTLAIMFKGEGFDSLLQNPCGFKIVDRLDIYIQIIGGDLSKASERNGVCNDQSRFILRDDPQRFTVTRGYLWGMHAYLAGRDAEWLKQNKPHCAEAAVYALETVSRVGPLDPLRSWVVASLLKSAKTWVQKIATDKPFDSIPDHPKDLPDLPAMR